MSRKHRRYRRVGRKKFHLAKARGRSYLFISTILTMQPEPNDACIYDGSRQNANLKISLHCAICSDESQKLRSQRKLILVVITGK